MNSSARAELPKKAPLGISRVYVGGFSLLVAILLLAPLIVYPVVVMKILCFALFACAFNLLMGYTGMLSFGHAAFFGMSSYVTAYAALAWGLTPELCLLLGVLTAALLGVLIGWLAIRREGIYFSMITLAFAQMVYFVCLQAPFTGGEDGLHGVPRGRLFGLIDLTSDMSLYIFVCVVFVGALMCIYRIIHSPFGQVLKALREHEPRAISMGFEVQRYKVVAFVISAALSGLAGGLKVLVFQVATLSDVFWGTSGDVVVMTLLGGVGTFFGPVVGAAIMVSMQDFLAPLGAWVTVVQGLILLMCILVFREGIVGLVERLGRRSR